MNTVPQQYYDTCARVRELLLQSQQQQMSKPRNEFSSPYPAPTPYRVQTLPDSQPNLDLVRMYFPLNMASKVASSIAIEEAASAYADEANETSEQKLDLEKRYALLMQRIVRDTRSV
jgi:hypothetical protein